MALFSSSGSCWRIVIALLFIHTCMFYVFLLRGSSSSKSLNLINKPSVNSHIPGNNDGLLLIRGPRIVNAIITEYNVTLKERLNSLIADKVSSRDPTLISLIREMMDPPSKHMIKPVRTVLHTPQSSEIMNILHKKMKGFFIEVGGLDGERSSNTFYLERNLGWTGLLIEMDPYFYTQLLGKSRHSWSINACISPFPNPIMMPFKEASGGSGQLLDKDNPKHSATRQVPCFPLESLLLALNTTHVDYFSLDVEGFELEVLKTIPFDRLDISTFSVEYVHGRYGKKSYKSFMEGQGYRTHKDIVVTKPDIALYVNDYIFVKNDMD